MTMYHEPVQELTPQDRDYVRALMSLKEEIEAIDWYHQRVAACADPELKKVLAHNRDEEMEHAVMTLEWLRRNMPGWDEQLRTYMFTSGDITMIEDLAEKSGTAPNAAAPGEAAAALGQTQPQSPGQSEAGSSSGGLGIGSLRKPS